jgi:hypothetical protein
MGTSLPYATACGAQAAPAAHDLHITVIAADTGEILRDLVLDPTRNYQPRGLKPGPRKGSPRQGGNPPQT